MKLPSLAPSFARRFAWLAVALFLLPAQALATWSIVVVNRATGEVCVASATCLSDFPLKRWVPVVVVGRGAGAAQSILDFNATNRIRIRDGLLAGWTADRILDKLIHFDSQHQSRQYGIVNFDSAPVTFTGTGAGQANFGVTGEVGDLAYAIQGNLLTDGSVVLAAEQALLNTPGDLGQKVMAGMEAARALGGDGRCSCSQSCPTCCGAPPPNFTHSAYTAFIVLARQGDTDGGCNTLGCATGDYYLSRVFNGNSSDPDPVIELQSRYDLWRAGKIGITDHILTELEPSAQKLVADGQSSLDVTIRLVDVDGTPHTAGGQTIALTHETGPLAAVPGPVVDNGDGTHTVTLTATSTPGRAHYKVVVQDGPADTVQLYPGLTVEVDPIAELHTGFYDVHAADGADVPFTLNSPADVGRPYLILGTFSGTSPGTQFGNITVPLNDDRLYQLTLTHPNAPFFPGSQGALDGGGRAEAVLPLSTPALLPYIGQRFEFSAVLFGSPDEVTNVVGFEVIP